MMTTTELAALVEQHRCGFAAGVQPQPAEACTDVGADDDFRGGMEMLGGLLGVVALAADRDWSRTMNRHLFTYYPIDNAPLGTPIRQQQGAQTRETAWKPSGTKGFYSRTNAEGRFEVAREEDVPKPASPAAETPSVLAAPTFSDCAQAWFDAPGNGLIGADAALLREFSGGAHRPGCFQQIPPDRRAEFIARCKALRA